MAIDPSLGYRGSGADPVITPILLAACNSRDPQPEPTYTLLSPSEQLVRVSMALRGERPTPEDLDRIEADPDALDALVDEYLHTPEFDDTIRDMHAELYLVRADTNDPFPPLGIMSDQTMQTLYYASSEEPLRLVEHVIHNDLPYTEIVTADYVVASELLAKMYDIPYDPTGPEWQVTQYTDGRVHAGVLSTSEPYRRHVSNGSNFHRGRANFWATTLLCESFATRDVEVQGGVDLSYDFEVAEAVTTNPTCIGCHQALDPLADMFWGFRRQLTGRNLRIGESYGCIADAYDPIDDPEELFTFIDDICYPMKMYTPANEGLWENYALRPPGYYGAPVEDLADLGRQIADDPRFAQCSARQFYRYFSQIGLDEVGPAQSARLQGELVDAAFDIRTYLHEVVTSEPFLALRSNDPDAEPAIPVQVVRPEQYARMIEALTGFRWMAVADKPSCIVEDTCWGPIDLADSDVFGFRAMSGGIDGLTVTQPTHTVTPVKLLVAARYATEAAAFVVASDLAKPDADRKLLHGVELDTEDEAALRRTMADLYRRILSVEVAADDPEIDDLLDLWRATRDDHGDAAPVESAWTVTISALLQDPAVLYY
jgi:hypothetical protein